jgi:hypothetical protein
MKAHGWLRHVIMRTSGTVGGAHRAPSTGTVRTWATRGILALALVSGSLGVAVAASPAHGSTSHVQVSAHNRPGHGSTSHVQASAHNRLPWMY